MFFSAIVRVMPSAFSRSLDLALQDAAQVEFGQPDVAVRVALHLGEFRQIVRIQVERQPLGDDRDAVLAPG